MEMQMLDSDSDTEEQIEFGVSKLRNIDGVTCYMNSVLHILQQCPEFIQFITQVQFRDTIMKKIESKKLKESLSEEQEIKVLKNFLVFELFRLFKTSHENDDSIIAPNRFKQIVGDKNDMWNERRYQDSQEFFNFLISNIQEDCGLKHEFIPGKLLPNMSDVIYSTLEKELSSFTRTIDTISNIVAQKNFMRFHTHEYSLLKDMFDGMTLITKQCIYCKSKNSTYEPYLHLQVSIPIDKLSSENKNKSFSIDECLEHFTDQEQLDEHNRWICNFCGLKNRALTKTELWKTPKIMVIHFKRFIFNAYGIVTNKITNNVDYPIYDLDLTKYFSTRSPFINKAKYNLFGVNIHESFGSAQNANSGHYTSYIKNMINHNWHLYNDSSSVKTLYNKQEIQNKNAYLLFYYLNDN
jgi:ubiquitin carboxyl-terminal hydrolase 8